MIVGVKSRVDLARFEKGMKRLSLSFGVEEVTTEAARVLMIFMEEFVTAAPIPSDYGTLANSRFVNVVDKSKGILRFGFGGPSAPYAAFQDQGSKSGWITVVPRKKKVLYIPLTTAGRRRHTYGTNPEHEGLVRGEDYVLAKEASIQIKPYGSAIGPNHYFSGTISRRWKWILNTIMRSLVRMAKEKLEAGEEVRK